MSHREWSSVVRVAVVAVISSGLVVPVSSVASVTTDGLTSPAVSPTTPPPRTVAPPAEARGVATALQRAVELFEATTEARGVVKQRRSEQDEIKTKLTAVSSERQLIAQQQQEAEQRLAELQSQQAQQLESLRKDLEAKINAELEHTRQQVSQQLEEELTRHVTAFETHQGEIIEQRLTHQLQLKERELNQLGREVEMQTGELVDRLTQLNTDAAVTAALQRSTADILVKRKAELEAQRARLIAQRDAELARRRATFIEQLKQQQQLEHQQRLTIKEASVRQSMAQLLQEARTDAQRQWASAQEAVEEIRSRATRAASAQTELTRRVEALEKDAAAETHRVQTLEAERQLALAQLEEAFQRAGTASSQATFAWFGQAIQQLPAELSSELGRLQQRVVAWVRQEQQLAQQRQVLRQRQLALQIAHEMETRYRQAQLKQQREQEAKAQRVEELLTKATQWAERGRFDDALRVIAEAQALSPDDAQRITAMREEMLAAQGRSAREAQMAKIQDTFTKAMKAFEQGQYEQAVTLFEQVIAQEASLNQEVKLAEGDASTP